MSGSVRTYPLSFDAGEIQEIEVTGNMFRVVDAPEELQISVDGAPFAIFNAGQGIKYQDNYRRLRIKSTLAQSVRLACGLGEFLDNNQQVQVTTTASVTPGNTLDNVADITMLTLTGAVLRGADAAGLTVIIKASSDNTAAVRVGAAGVGAGTGYPLEPGESISISTTSAINAYNPSGASQTVHVLPVRLV